MRVYIAGPMSSSGEPGRNLHAAARLAGELLARGHAPFVPHAYWIVDAVAPTAREHWLRADRDWLDVSDAVIRLPGESRGADEECRHARRRGCPVYGSLEELLEKEER